MKILLEAHHPAHIHFWKYPVRELQALGHEVLMIGRDRDVMRRLLEVYDWIPAEIPRRRTQRNRFPLFEMLERQWAVASAIRRFKPDVVASLMGSYTQSAKLLRVRNVVFTDSEFQHFNHRIAHPFADEIHTPECFYKDLGPKQRRYNGIHELAFLGHAYFRPDSGALTRNGLTCGDYCVVRLSAWNTLHDIHHSGVGSLIYDFIARHESSTRFILVAEEDSLPRELRSYALMPAAEDFHSLLWFARFVLTEGASTASEAACLGVPTVYINSTLSRGYLLELEKKYSTILANFRDSAVGMRVAHKRLSNLEENKIAYNQTQREAHLERISVENQDMPAYIVRVIEGVVNQTSA